MTDGDTGPGALDDSEARVRAAFRGQGKACAGLGSPFMGRLMPLLARHLTHDTPVGARVLSWGGDPGPGGQSVPLRLAGALHGLVLSGADSDLAAAYPPNAVPDAALWSAVSAALVTHETTIMAWLDRAPQTNEVRRSSILLPALWWTLERTGDLPIDLSELGASAGLNLNLDSFGIETPWGRAGAPDSVVLLRPDWRAPPPRPRALTIVDRRGVDLHPVDIRDPLHALRLLSYLWPDQPDRLGLTRGAMALNRAPPDAGDAAPWLEQRLASRAAGRLHVVYSTIAWQYFPPETQSRCTSALEEAGATADPASPLAHIAFEADGRADGAALTVRVWPHAPRPQVLARGDFHGRWVDWQS